ncbi:MAG: UDP-N-acetylmuramate dehydrogenase [Phycisphaeraceae bacterium]|nr:UDP-N-acetylmuramate dehydrogenase [Phycisphaeraceae bacterium]
MQAILDELNVRYETDVPMGPLTWIGVGGVARHLAHPSSVQQLATLVRRAQESNVPIRVLGDGANLLVASDAVDGIVLKLDEPQFDQVQMEGNLVTVGAGRDLPRLTLQTVKAGLSGLECLAGIPGSVGGAVRMNAGGNYGDIGHSVTRLQVMDAFGQVYYRDRDDLVFSYRKTNIRAPLILQAQFELTPDDPEVLMKQVKEIFLYKKNTQPLQDSSAGCAFKNPSPPKDSDELANPAQRLSAGALIDRAGLKGYQIGGAQVSHRHANFLVSLPDCQPRDILALLEHVQKTVLERFGVQLEREVVVW